jgi:hypothetical protein
MLVADLQKITPVYRIRRRQHISFRSSEPRQYGILIYAMPIPASQSKASSAYALKGVKLARAALVIINQQIGCAVISIHPG